MRFARPPRRAPRESVVPMINVVFLLLIFFLMTAEIAPPPPAEVTLPEAAREAPVRAERVLYLDADGRAALAGAADRDPWDALAAGSGPVALRADADLSAAALARALARLRRLGIAGVDLAVRPR